MMAKSMFKKPVSKFRQPAMPLVVEPTGVSPPGADVPDVVSGTIITSTWGSSVADDLAELHTKTATAFTATTPGVVPPSGGGSSTYLRADGTWASGPVGPPGPPGPGVPPGGTAGQVIVHNGATTVWQSKPQLDVRDFGAKGDGATDDTAAIQAAIDTASTVQGTVVVPPGTYLFTKLVVKANVTMTSAGGWLKLRDGVCIDSAVSYFPIANAEGTSPNVVVYPNVRLIGLLVDGNAGNNLLFTVADLITLGGIGAEIRNCHLINPPDSGIMFSQVIGGVCRDNRVEAPITGNNDAGIYVNDGDGTKMRDCVISANRISGFTAGGIALKRISSRLVVTDNVIFDCGNGITFENASTTTDNSTDNIVTGNRIRHVGYIGSSGVGIDLRGCDWVTCANNRIEDPKSIGIHVQGARYCSVANNIISIDAAADATCDGIRITDRSALTRGTSQCSFQANIVTTARRNGFMLTAGAGNSSIQNIYIGNIVVQAAGTAFRIEATHDFLTVVGNIFGGGIDVEVFAGAVSVQAANNYLATGVTSGAWTQIAMASETGRFSIGNPDTYITRAAADLVDGPIYRSRGSVVAFQGGTYPVTIGNVGQSAPGVGFGSALDCTIFRTAAGKLRTPGDWDIGGVLTHRGTTAGFYNATAIARPTVNAAATDATTTQNLVNSLRTALVNLGLVQ